MRRTVVHLLALGGLATVVMAGAPAKTAVAAECEALPKVPWWVQSHKGVIASVKGKYKGDWDKYIVRWEKYRTAMQRNVDAGSSAYIKSRDLRLEGPTLEAHVKDIDTRLKVLKCLRDQQAPGKKTRETDARPAVPPGEEVVASVSDGALELEIVARCVSGAPVFQITNLGDKWPRLAAVNIYNTNDKSSLTKRRMRLVNSQQATFGVPKKKLRKLKVKEVGLWIEPSWTKRKFVYDSKIAC